MWEAWQSVVATHGQVHKGEHVELRHNGEAQKHTIQEQAPAAQLLVQLPLVQVDAKHLQTQRRPQWVLGGGLQWLRGLGVAQAKS